MGNETLQWRLRLRDDTSQPARRAAGGLRTYRAELARLQRQQERAAQTVARRNAQAFARDQRDAARAVARQQRTAQQQARVAQQSATRNAATFARGQAAMRSSMVEGLGILGGLGLAAAGVVAGIAESFASVGVAAARSVIEIAAFRESSLTSLRAVLGSSEAAGRQFRNAITIANQTPLDTQDVIAQTASFAIAGFQEREIQPLVAASADLGAAFGQRASEGFSFALSQIRAAGQLQGQELLQLQNANVSREAVLASIARQMGLGTGEAGNRAALNAIRQRRVSSAVGSQAALDAVSQRLDRGGPLGSFARAQSETLTGAISNARNALFNLLVGINFDRVPGITAFKNALLAITGALQDGSPAAATLRSMVTGAANAVGGLLARVVTPQNIAGAFTAVSGAVQSIGRFATAAWPVVRAFVGAIGPGFMAGVAPLRAMFGSLTTGGAPSARTLQVIASAAAGLGRAIGFVVGSIATFLATTSAFVAGVSVLWTTIAGFAASGTAIVVNGFRSIGTAIVDGITGGIRDRALRLRDSVMELGTGAVQAARDALGIHSPSRVFADAVGANIPPGVAMGIDRAAPQLDAAVASVVQPPAIRGGGFGAVTITIPITVQRGAGDEATATAIRDRLEEDLADVFGRLAESFA